MLSGLQCRLYPTEEQKTLMSKHFGCCRWIYNHFLSLHDEAYKKEGKKWNKKEYINKLPGLKKQKETEWLKEVNSQSLQQAVIHLNDAYERFFNPELPNRHPRFKSGKDENQSFSVPQHFKLEGNKLIIPKFKKGIEIVIHRKIKGVIRNVTIKKDCSDNYYASLIVEDGKEEPEILIDNLDKEKARGIDLGIKDFGALSNGEKIPNPRHYIKGQKKLKKLQRKKFKKKKNSANRNKARRKAAKQHKKVSNQRKDFHHKLSRRIVNDKQVDIICVEKLNIAGLKKNPKLAKHISDAGWGQFKTFLKYKAQRAGKLVIEIGTFEPSSRLCHKCNYKNEDLTLEMRYWTCPECNTFHDRDINAAINIVKIAMDGTARSNKNNKACGDVASTSDFPKKKQAMSGKQEAPPFRGE